MKIGEELARKAAWFESRERSRGPGPARREFSVDGGLLTPRTSVGWRVVVERYHDEPEALYDA